MEERATLVTEPSMKARLEASIVAVSVQPALGHAGRFMIALTVFRTWMR
jgi:hypothetical protein